MDWLAIFKETGPYILPSAGAAFAVWKTWGSSRTDLIKVAQDAAGEVIKDLRDEIDRLRARFDDLQNRHDRMMADKDAEIAVLKAALAMRDGEIRQKDALIAGYQKILRENDIPQPMIARPYWEIHDGSLTPAGGGVITP